MRPKARVQGSTYGAGSLTAPLRKDQVVNNRTTSRQKREARNRHAALQRHYDQTHGVTVTVGDNRAEMKAQITLLKGA